jgi:hypothetical protein
VPRVIRSGEAEGGPVAVVEAVELRLHGRRAQVERMARRWLLDGASAAEIGREEGLSGERVRQLIRAFLAILRQETGVARMGPRPLPWGLRRVQGRDLLRAWLELEQGGVGGPGR